MQKYNMSQKNRKIIKKPIMTKDFSITIFLNFYKDKIKIDIKLSIITMFYFNYLIFLYYQFIIGYLLIC